MPPLFQKIMKTTHSLMALALAAVALCGCKNTERTEALTAEIEAAQVEGRNAAREFVNREWKDTMELQSRLLEVRSMQSKYEEARMPEAAAAFDSTFVSTLRSVRPDIAKELDKVPAKPQKPAVEKNRDKAKWATD